MLILVSIIGLLIGWEVGGIFGLLVVLAIVLLILRDIFWFDSGRKG